MKLSDSSKRSNLILKKKKRKPVTVSIHSISKFSQHLKEVMHVTKPELFYRFVSKVLLILKTDLSFQWKLGYTETSPSACVTSHSGRNQKPPRN